MLGAMHLVYYINWSITTNVYSTYLGYLQTTHNVLCLVANSGRKPVRSRSLSPPLNQLRHTCHSHINPY